MNSPSNIARILAAPGSDIAIRAWVRHLAVQGDLIFLTLRDGSGFVQAVVSRREVDAATWAAAAAAGVESSVEVIGGSVAEPRAPGGCEIRVGKLRILHAADGPAIVSRRDDAAALLDRRHLWLRSPRQCALMAVRSTVASAARGFLVGEGFVELDAPVLTRARDAGDPADAGLLSTDYYGDRAYLSRSGRLYMAAGAAALGRVYCCGPVFAAPGSGEPERPVEKWLIEPEAAWLDCAGAMDLAERLVMSIASRTLSDHRDLLAVVLERDPGPIEKAVGGGFPRPGSGPDEHPQRLRFVEEPPAGHGDFTLAPHPEDPRRELSFALVAPGEPGALLYGGERTTDRELLAQRIAEHRLSRRDLEWLLDLGSYGSFDHSGFSLDLERVVAWLTGARHEWEVIPFPRFRDRIHP